jgi:hypothetical protein
VFVGLLPPILYPQDEAYNVDKVDLFELLLQAGRRMKSVPMAFYANVPTTLFPKSNLDSSFDGWRFDESAGPKPEGLEEETIDEVDISGDVSVEVSNRLEEECEGEDSMEEDVSEEVSSDGSQGSRSRSEQSEDDLLQPAFKRLRG